jgi:hypothetical protein
MSEVQLQGLLDRTKPSQGGEEAMDMTTINGIRVNKYSIKAIKVSEKVDAQMREEFEQFNSEHVGEDSVFPTYNGAPKILERFKDKPYTLELRDEFTTGTKLESLPTIKAMHYPATCKVLGHFVRTTPVVEKCDDLRCFSRLREARLYKGFTSYLLSCHNGRTYKPLFKTGSKHAITRHRRDQKASRL